MPLTTIQSSGTKVIGSSTLIPQLLHPAVFTASVLSASLGTVLTSAQINSANNLVWGLVQSGLWTKIVGLYLFLGGTAASHKINWKNPLDTDAAFRLNFVGGWTHNSNGVTPNGTTGYANTFIVPSTSFSANSMHLAMYSRTSGIVNFQRDIAVFTSGLNPCISLGTNTGAIITDSNDLNNRLSVSAASVSKFIVATRTSSTAHLLYRDGALIGSTSTTNSASFPSQSIYIGAANVMPSSASGTAFSTKNYAAVSIGDGLTAIEVLVYKNIMDAFQIANSRNV